MKLAFLLLSLVSSGWSQTTTQDREHRSLKKESRVDSIDKQVRELKSGRANVTGRPIFKNGIEFGDGSFQVTAPSVTVNAGISINVGNVISTGYIRTDGYLQASSAAILGNLGIRGPRPWVDIHAYGAKGDGTTNDTAAILSAVSAINTAGGGTLRCQPGLTYIVQTVAAAPLFTFQNLNGLVIDCAGATIKDTVVYSSQYDDTTNPVDIFRIKNSTGVWIKIGIQSQVLGNADNKIGAAMIKFVEGVSDVTADVICKGGVYCLYFYRTSSEPLGYASRNINAKVTSSQTEYGLMLNRSGNNVVAEINAEYAGRAIFAAGVSNVIARVSDKNQYGASEIGAFGGDGVSDLDLYYYNRESSSGTNGSNQPLILQFSDQTPATFRNIKITLDVYNPDATPFGPTFQLIKCDNSGCGQDTVGRGHVIDGLDISGYSRQATGKNHMDTYGAFAYPDVQTRIRVHDLRLDSIDTVSSSFTINLGALADTALFENIIATRSEVSGVNGSNGVVVFDNVTARYLAPGGSSASTDVQTYSNSSTTASGKDSFNNKTIVNSVIGGVRYEYTSGMPATGVQGWPFGVNANANNAGKFHLATNLNMRFTNTGSSSTMSSYSDNDSARAPMALDASGLSLLPSGGGKVGIGINDPHATLEVSGPDPGIILSSGSFAQQRIGVIAYGVATGNSFDVYAAADHPLGLGANGTNGILIDVSQNVGIGTTSPGFKLDVNGTARASAFLGVSGATETTNASLRGVGTVANPLGIDSSSGVVRNASGFVPNDQIDSSSITKMGNGFNGASQLTKLDANKALQLYGSITATTGTFTGNAFKVNSTDFVVSVGSVGIGTSSPGASLDVAGTGIMASSITVSGHNILGAWYAWTPTYAGVTSPSTNVARYMKVGKTVCIQVYATGTGSSAGYTFTLPFTSKSADEAIFMGWSKDNGTIQTGPIGSTLTAGSATVSLYPKIDASVGWTASGARFFSAHGCYECE